MTSWLRLLPGMNSPPAMALAQIDPVRFLYIFKLVPVFLFHSLFQTAV